MKGKKGGNLNAILKAISICLGCLNDKGGGRSLLKFKDELAIVTGGYSGIGAAVTQNLLANGAICVLIGRSYEKAMKFIRENAEQEEHIDFYETDVSDVYQVLKTVSEIQEKYQAVRMLVNCAGIASRQPAMEYDIETWKKVIDVNLNGSFYMSQAVGNVMKELGGGRIVNIGSLFSDMGGYDLISYAASKGGINQLTKSLAIEWAVHDIRVNQVNPGYVVTPLNAHTFDKQAYKDTVINRTPLQRLGTTEDIANTISFLLSKEADFITGETINVDGGILCGDPTLRP